MWIWLPLIYASLTLLWLLIPCQCMLSYSTLYRFFSWSILGQYIHSRCNILYILSPFSYIWLNIRPFSGRTTYRRTVCFFTLESRCKKAPTHRSAHKIKTTADKCSIEDFPKLIHEKQKSHKAKILIGQYVVIEVMNKEITSLKYGWLKERCICSFWEKYWIPQCVLFLVDSYWYTMYNFIKSTLEEIGFGAFCVVWVWNTPRMAQKLT